MEVDSALHSPSRSPSAEARPSSTLEGYSFPGEPQPPSSDGVESSHDAMYSPEASSAYVAAPPDHPGYAYSVEGEATPIPDIQQQPRSMSMSGGGSMTLEAARAAARAAVGAEQEEDGGEGYSALGRAISTGGPVNRVMSSFAFSSYMPNGADDRQASAPPAASTSAFAFAPPAPPPGHQSRFSAPPPHPQYLAYQAQLARQQQHQQQQHGYEAPPPHPGFAHPPPSSHGHGEGEECTGCLEEEMARHQAYGGLQRPYTPYHMQRTTSSFSDSEASYNYGTSHHGSDAAYEAAYAATGYPSPYYTEAAYYAAARANAEEGYALGARAQSAAPVAKTSRMGGRRKHDNVFHPSPQSMLAPGAVPSAGSLSSKGRVAPFPGTNKPGLPTEDDFAKMPTKRSRGRRPPGKLELLGAVEDPNINPTEAHIRYCGVTKTGKPKKIFLCKVPDCGKVFKRSEHLKRHVRSIHTDEKPFQCQWPSCGRFFSRHDNLSQHLRVHRQPHQSDLEFSQMLEQCFGPREDRRIPAHRQRDIIPYEEGQLSAELSDSEFAEYE